MRRITLRAALSAAVIAALAIGVVGAAAAPSAYETTVKASNPLVYYRMADTQLPIGIATLRDSSGREKHGNYSFAGGITQSQASAIAGDAADFSVSSDGRDAVAGVSGPDLPVGDAARTVEAWYKSPAPPFTFARQAIVTWGGGFGRGAFGMQVEADKLWVDVFQGQGAFVAPANLQDGEWHHLAITYDPAASPKFNGYADGTKLALAASDPPFDTSSPLATGGADPLLLGAWPWGGVAGLNGSLDEVAIYGSALSADTIKAHADTGTGAGCTGAQPADNEAASCVTANVVSQFAVRLNPASVDFGNVVTGGTYPRLQEIFVEKNDEQGGYQLSVSRTAFTPSDLNLSIGCATANQAGTAVCSAPNPSTLLWDLVVGTPSPITKPPDAPTPIGHRTTGATGTGTQADSWPAALVLQVPAGTVAGRYSAVVTYSATVTP
jgi:hypothetical protein